MKNKLIGLLSTLSEDCTKISAHLDLLWTNKSMKIAPWEKMAMPLEAPNLKSIPCFIPILCTMCS